MRFIAAPVLALVCISAFAQIPLVSVNALPTITPPAMTPTLNATVSVPGVPNPVGLTLRWCKVSGPGPVVFDDPGEASTRVSFDIAGTYEVGLEARLGAQVGFDSINVTVQRISTLPAPVMNILDATPLNGLDPIYAQRFLTYPSRRNTNLPLPQVGIPVQATSAQYYASVDPNNRRSNFDAWKIENGFDLTSPNLAIIGDSSNGCCSAAVFENANDLGFGRRMVMARDGDRVAYYVTNYLDTEDAIADRNVILTVCMEFSPNEAAGGVGSFVKFFMFDGQGARIGSVDFDGRGLKDLPMSCIPCHGGNLDSTGALPADGDVGAQMLPFDLQTFEYDCQPGFERAALEPTFKEFNAGVLATDPPLAIRELVAGFYGAVPVDPTRWFSPFLVTDPVSGDLVPDQRRIFLPDEVQNSGFVPDGWSEDPNTYLHSFAPGCRSCHISRANDFRARSNIAQLQAGTSAGLVFGPGPNGFLMPHAERTFQRFWASANPPQWRILQDAVAGDLTKPPTSRLFVDATAIGAGDGSTWNDAFLRLDDALSAAAASGGSVLEVWVAAGTYRPDTSLLAEPRDASFGLVSGVSVYGGFAGGETGIADRDPEANPTILSGDLAANDLPGFLNRADNVFHVLRSSANDARLDGFFVRGGAALAPAAETRGGGLLCVGGSPVIVDCCFEDNEAVEGGAAAFDGAEGVVINARFSGNRAERGGALIGRAASTTRIASSLFESNEAILPDGRGGALFDDGSSLQLVNLTVLNNVAATDGAGIVAVNGASTRLRNAILWANSDAGGVDESAQIFDDASGAANSLDVAFCQIQGLASLVGSNNDGSDPMLDAGGAPMAGSSAIDSGSNDVLAKDIFDLDRDLDPLEPEPFDRDGDVRRFDDGMTLDAGLGDAPIVDRGAFEFSKPSLGACADGNVEINLGGPIDVISVNGSTGGSARRVDLGMGQPFTINVGVPPSGPPLARFALFAKLGAVSDADAVALPLGIGVACVRPQPLFPFDGSLFTLADAYGIFPLSFLSTGPAPLAIPVPGGLSTELVVSLQGIIDDPSAATGLAVTNAIVLNVLDNQIPIALAGPDFQVTAGDPVQLDGSSSIDPEGAPLTFDWQQTAGTPVVLNLADPVRPTFTAPLAPGLLSFELIVSDGELFSAPDPINVDVVAANLAPVAQISGAVCLDATRGCAVAGQNYVLDGSGSTDPDAGPGALTYSWDEITTGGDLAGIVGALNQPTLTITAPTMAQVLAAFAPATNVDFVLRFELTVDDGEDSDVETFDVIITPSYASDVHPIWGTLPGGGQPPYCVGPATACTSCHRSGGTASFMQLDSADPNVTHGIVTVGNRVVPSTDPNVAATSLFLVRPTSNAHTGGAKFCLPGDPDFPHPRYRIIQRWIMDGALNN